MILLDTKCETITVLQCKHTLQPTVHEYADVCVHCAMAATNEGHRSSLSQYAPALLAAIKGLCHYMFIT